MPMKPLVPFQCALKLTHCLLPTSEASFRFSARTEKKSTYQSHLASRYLLANEPIANSINHCPFIGREDPNFFLPKLGRAEIVRTELREAKFIPSLSAS
jgi:hypothetical protein